MPRCVGSPGGLNPVVQNAAIVNAGTFTRSSSSLALQFGAHF